MPVLMWQKTDEEKMYSRVVTSWRAEFDGEEYRDLAETLDVQIDKVLDSAVELFDKNRYIEAQREFIRIWSLGRAVANSEILQHDAMKNELRVNLWLAMDQKALLGVRCDGETEDAWSNIRSNVRRITSRPDRHLFEVGLWLQQQELMEARDTFIGRSGIVSELFRRPAIRSLKMRQALQRWISAQMPDTHDWLLVKSNYISLAKAIVKRWPARGPGSAKKPEHYTDERLDVELARVLDPLVKAD